MQLNNTPDKDKPPDKDHAVRLLRERFFNRTDHVAILAPWGKPCPVEANGSLDSLLLGHLLGDEVPESKVRYKNRRGSGAMMGRFRIGSYCPGPDHTTRWLCIDFDGAGHAGALTDPRAAATATLNTFERAGLAAYLERSGGGKGWHLWCFFDPPVVAAKARALGRALAPKDAPLADGGVADPLAGRGIEVFPKQSKIRRRGFGNLVWLPWWRGATDGANHFYRSGTDGSFDPFVPENFSTVSIEAVERALANASAETKVTSSTSSANRVSGDDADWAEWRRRALAALPLEVVYGTWLTGKTAGASWLECRDPASPSGDQHPSAGVADGTGEAERGTFHSFISGQSLSVFDFLLEHGGLADFRAARARIAELSAVPEPAHRDALATDSQKPKLQKRKPHIIIRTAEHEVVDEAIAALSNLDGVYCRGQLLVHIVTDASKLAGIVHPGGAARIVPIGTAGVRDRLTAAADWFTIKETDSELEEVPAHPPTWAAPAVEARKNWPRMRYLEGIVESPVLRYDGSILDKPGYDDATGLLYRPNARYQTIAEHPSITDARDAADRLLDIVCDFPFKSDAHRAAWVAAVLTPLARYAFRGPSPLFLMDANVRSAGKSLLADVTSEVLCGRDMPRTPQARDENEEIKRITAIALEGDRFVLLDNIIRPLGSGALDALLTATVWSERVLGKSEKVTLPLLTVWYGTGNNVTFKGDTARRCLHIRLDSDLERPEYRADFKYPELLPYVHEHRAQLIVAGLIILRAYCCNGRPNMKLKPWGSFEGWSSMVRNAIVWAGLADPGDTRTELDEVDTDSMVLADLIAGWQQLPDDAGTNGCTVAQALQALRDDADGSRYARLHSALDELCPHPNGQLPTARKVGYALRRFHGRVSSGCKLQMRVARGNRLWFVQQVNNPSPESEATQATLDLGRETARVDLGDDFWNQ